MSKITHEFERLENLSLHQILVLVYFGAWNCIDDPDTAERLARASVHPEFVGRFPGNLTGYQKVLQIARNRRNAFDGSWFSVNERHITINKADEV